MSLQMIENLFKTSIAPTKVISCLKLPRFDRSAGCENIVASVSDLVWKVLASMATWRLCQRVNISVFFLHRPKKVLWFVSISLAAEIMNV